MSAGLEGLFAGKRVKQYFASLRFPSYSAPLWAWSIIGVLYYAMCFFVLYRMLRHEGDTIIRNVSLTLILLLMMANALWNYVFFRARNLFLSFVSVFPYLLAAIGLFCCLIQFDTSAAWSVAAYLLYSAYAVRWGYCVWKLNEAQLR